VTLTAALSVALVLSAGCGTDDSAGRCGEPVREPIDPGQMLHVLPGSDVVYETDPPTSGPHAATAPSGLSASPLPPPVQVAVLERGDVLIQYDPTLPEDRLRVVQRLAEGPVVVAPNDALPAPVVLTAWGWKLLCEGLDLDRVDRFVADHAGRTTGH
jgi:hypothetical protein